MFTPVVIRGSIVTSVRRTVMGTEVNLRRPAKQTLERNVGISTCHLGEGRGVWAVGVGSALSLPSRPTRNPHSLDFLRTGPAEVLLNLM